MHKLIGRVARNQRDLTAGVTTVTALGPMNSRIQSPNASVPLRTTRLGRLAGALRCSRKAAGRSSGCGKKPPKPWARVAVAACLMASPLVFVPGPAGAAPNPDTTNPWDIALAINWSTSSGPAGENATFLEPGGVSLNSFCGSCNFLNGYSISLSGGGVISPGDTTTTASDEYSTVDHVNLFDEPGPDGPSDAVGSMGEVFVAPASGTLSQFDMDMACKFPGPNPDIFVSLFQLTSGGGSISSEVASVPFPLSQCGTVTTFDPPPVLFFWGQFFFNAPVTSGDTYAVLLTGTAIGGAEPISAPMTFSTTTISAATVGSPYDYTLSADGSPAPTYAVTSGALPAGLSLNPTTGAITGTPTAAGAYSFTVTATNANGSTSQAFSGTVQAVAPTEFSTTTIAPTTVGSPYDYTISANGSPAPTYAVTSGSLPAGLSLNPTTGEITGTPTTAGAYSFTVTATNAGGSTEQAFSGTVQAAPVAPTEFSPTTIAPATVSYLYFDAVSANGSPAPTYAVTSGSLPAGLSLDATTGEITGTPTTAGPTASP